MCMCTICKYAHRHKYKILLLSSICVKEKIRAIENLHTHHETGSFVHFIFTLVSAELKNENACAQKFLKSILSV